MSDIYKATKNKVVDTAFEKPDVYKATSNKQVDPQISIKNKTRTFALNSMPFPSGTITPSKMKTHIQQNLGSGINKPPVHPIINDDYKQFRYDSLKLDTLGADISKAGDAVKTAYSGWQDKKSMESLKPTIENAYNRLKMLDSYNADYGDGSVDVSEQLKAYKSILDEWDEIAETYGKYDSADKYNKAQAESNAYIEKMKKMEGVNLETLGAEVEAWEKERNKIIDNKEWLNKGDWRNDENGTPAIPYSATSIPAFVGKNIMEMQEMVAKKKELYNLAKRHQDLQKLSSVLDKTSENYDKNAEKYIKKGKELDFQKVGNDYSTDYVNEEGVNTGTTYIIDDLRAAAIALAEHNGTPKTETNGDNYRDVKKYRHLKENEFDLFAYYLGKDEETGGNQAREYLDMMDETLKTRMGTETYEKYLKDNSLLETLYAVPVGLNQFASGVTNLFNTKDDYIPVSPTQVAGQLAREDLSDAGFKLPKWLGGSSFGQGVYDVLSTTANMAPSILASAVANYVVPGSGAYVGGTLMGASAKGNAYQEALNGGMDKSQARTYSTLVGISEAALSALLSKAMGGKALEGKVKDVIDGIDNKFLKFAANYGVAFTSEGLEEGLQEVLTPFFENFALGYGKNGFDDIDWGEVAYSYLLGGLSGGMFEAGPTAVKGAVNYLKNVNYVKETYGAGATIDNLINLGLSLPTETKAYKYAKQINDNVNSGKKVSSNKLYNLVLATENIVADRLNQLGETSNLLQTADAVVKKLSGLELTVLEIETLSKSSYGQEVLENMTPKAESAETTLQDTESGVVGENVSAAESGVPSATAESGSGNVGFTEPTDQEIYRDPTPQENEEAMFGTRKNAKQRHILDVAKKLDSNMKVVFVNKNSKTLNNKNGKYNRNTNTMYIAKDLSAVEMYAEVFKHEFIHRLESRKAYQSFKNYLFKKSEAFEAYANARLFYADKLDIERTRDEAINGLIDMYVENTKGDLNLTREQAEREAVADFVARTLFKDKNANFIQAIKDKNIKDDEGGIGFAQMESDLALFEEMAKTDRNLFQKIIDAIRDLIASIKGMPNLEKDLKYLEERLARVYESAENKKTATESGKVYAKESFSSDENIENENIASGKKAINELIDKADKGLGSENLSIKNAMYRSDLGYIDFVWGKPGEGPKFKKGYGLAHIIAKRNAETGNGKQVAYELVNVLAKGTKIEVQRVQSVSGNDRIRISYNNHTAVLSESPEGNHWLLTGWENKEETTTSANGEVRDSSKATAVTPTLTRRNRDVIVSDTSIANFVEDVKQKQLDIILESNPAPNTYQTWVRSVDDIHTWNEVLELNDESEGQFVWGDFSRADAEQALQDGKITIYSSYPIKNGVFVSTSKIQAQEYAGGKNGKVYSKTVPLDSVAWINGDEGQYARVENIDNEPYSSDDLSTLQRDLYSRHKNGELTNEEYLEETDKLWGKANVEYGSFPQGEKAQLNMPVPMAVAEDKPTERFVRTIIETDSLKGDMLEGIEERVLLGDFSYKVISDEKAIKTANRALENKTANTIWDDTVSSGKRITKNQIAIGEKLLESAIKNGDTFEVLKLSAELADIFTRAGQVVQSARLLKKMTGAGRLVSLQRTVKTINKDLRTKYGEDYPPIKISEESAKRLAEAKTAGGVEHAYQEIMQEVADQVPVTFLDKWNAWRYFAMLSNPKTHIRNFIGNGFFLPIVIFKDAIGTGLEAVTIRDNAQKTKAFIVKKEYYRYAYNDGKLKSVKNLLKGNKYNDKTAIREKQRIFKNEALEFLTNFNSNALEAEDMLFKNIHYIHALAGFLQARKVDLKNVNQDVLDEARIYAVKEAKKATFNDESALANAIQRFGNKNLAANMLVEGVLPFKRTPINIVKRGIEYSPIGLIKTATKGLYDVKKGKITLSECIDGFASGLIGTGLLALGWVLASMGAVSGGEKDDDESQFEKLLGKQEYAIEIGDKSYTVDWAAPANIPFFIGVEIANISREDEDFTFANVFNTMWNALEPITNLSMLSGIQSVIESARYAKPSQVISSIAVDALTSYGMQGLPSLLGATARTIDSKQRSWYIDKNDKWLDSTAQTIKNNIQSKVPGLTKTQIPKIDMWGREVSRGKVGERILENFISPGYYSAIEYNETSEELKRIFKETDVDVFPNLAEKSFAVDKKTKYLTADEYVTYAKAKGNYSFDYLKEFMEHSSYKRLTDAEKADVITDLYKYANAKAKTTVSDYDLMKSFKTVTNWERNGRSAVDYYIYQAINK